jgi:branched-chain amino acid transport system substrate-binding protein
MCKFINTAFILLVLCLTAQAGQILFQKTASPKAFFDAGEHQTSYNGPGRHEPPPTDIEEVLIGYFGPGTFADPEAGDMWRAASLAVEQANHDGGYKGLPFRLVAGWSQNPWGSGVKEVARMAYVHKVWAVIGGIDGPSTHLAEQVVAKARLTLVSPASTDKTVNLANVPWMFSCLPSDNLQAPLLAEAVYSNLGVKPFILASATDHDSHLFTTELTSSFIKYKISPSYHFEFKPAGNDFSHLVKKIISSDAEALVIIAGAKDSAGLIWAVREKNFTKLIFAGPHAGHSHFLIEAGRSAENVIFPLLYVPGESSETFEKDFTHLFGNPPDYLAAHTYDAVNLLIAAIRKAGLNRTRICDEVRNLSPWQGVTGQIHWDGLGRNTRPVVLGTYENCRIVTYQLKSSSAYLLPLSCELPSVSVTSLSTAMSLKTSTPPPIHRTSILSTFSCLPSPK